ncbi:MAG: BBP7 family outer membrane beta-barrel protein, partial [Planctomycetota bacterium]
FTLGYRFRDHVSFTVGYTFLYFDNVAMAGQQINRFQDTDDLGANVTPVSYDIVEGSHWVQGISLGASIDF